MLKRILSLLAVLSALALWLLASPARAALVTVSDTVSVAFSNSDPTTLTLQKFHGSLDSLREVRVVFDASTLVQFKAFECNELLCQLFLPYDFTLSLNDFSSGEIEFLNVSQRVQGFSSCSVGIGDICAPASSPTAQISGDDSSVDPATLALFAGADTFSLSFMSSGGARTTAQATVTYTYDDSPAAGLPEPGTLAAVSLALLALGVARRTRPTRAR